MAELIPPSQITSMRRDYMLRGLDEASLDPDPFQQFTLWFQDALDSKAILEPNAMVLSTVSPEGHPRGRFVLLKGVSTDGFVFFTHYQSTKGCHLAANPYAALTFGWSELERQICIEGQVTKTSRAATETYFRTRPRGSRLGAWASQQSQVVPNRETLDAQLAHADMTQPADVPPPPEWGGYCLKPERIEFWQGRLNRLHDRLVYRRQGTEWLIERLAP